MNFLKTHKRAIAGIGACLLIGGITLSFQDTPFTYVQHFTQEPVVTDTVPEKSCCPDKDKGISMKEFDNLSEDMEKQILKATDEIKKIDWTAIEKEVKEAMKEVDMDKIKTEVESAMKEVDMQKISKEVTDALKEVDMKQINIEIKNALEESKKEISKINKEDINKELANAKVEIEKAKAEVQHINVDKIMAEAKTGIDEAKAELKNIRLMFDELEKDGLISKKDGFKVEYKDKSLYLNDKKQTDEVTSKYRHYFHDDHFKIIINKDKEE